MHQQYPSSTITGSHVSSPTRCLRAAFLLAWQAMVPGVWLHQQLQKNIKDKSQGTKFAPVSLSFLPASKCSGLKYRGEHLFGAGSRSCPPRAADTGARRAALLSPGTAAGEKLRSCSITEQLLVVPCSTACGAVDGGQGTTKKLNASIAQQGWRNAALNPLKPLACC